MTGTRFTTRVLATLTLWAGFGLTAYAQLPQLTAEKAFDTKPRQPGVQVTTPGGPEIARHRVDPIPDPKDAKQTIGYVVRDPDGKPARQFVSYDGKGFNIIAYYANGQEAYREVYPPNPKEPFQFRWLGPNGGKWGLDRDRDGKIDEWVVISPEEASQELFDAVRTRDAKRLDALLPTPESLTTMGLPAAEANAIRERASKAAAKLAEAAEQLKLTPEAKWVHLETAPPHTTPGDAFGSRTDKVVHKNCVILIQDGKDTKFLQTGEMIQVGQAWKLVDGPTAGAGGPGSASTPNEQDVPAPVIPLIEQLNKIDQTEVPNPPTPEKLAAFNAKRAAKLEEIVAKLPPDKQEMWVKMLVDALTASCDGGKPDNPQFARLRQLTDAIVKGSPKTPLAAYAAFRVVVAENAIALNTLKDKPLEEAQAKYRAGLEDLIKTYPQAEDAVEANLRLAMAYEFDKDGEAKAKEWYAHLAKTYQQHPHAAKAAGAIRRLESVGKPLDLQGPNLTNGQAFTPGQVAGKVVVVYYWASWSPTLAEDAKKLTELVKTYGPKGLVLVTVGLDDDPNQAKQALNQLQLPGTHLHLPGGVDRSPLAAAYGIHVPPHLLVAGKDGKVVNRAAQITTLEDEVKKLTQ
jgi:thiol-disulfide isomerase/thioredoxin